jgi:Zn-dependent M28 family amino/carboxypeptidase
MDVQIENKFVPVFKSQNICGFFPGTEKKDSFIVFTAHYDHLGGMGSQTFFPGANDNASGVSMLLQLVRYYKEHPPKYNIAFVFFAGEEAGLVGSKFFTENPLIPLGKIKFLVNLDLLGTGDEGITVVNATEFKREFEILKSINTEKKLLALVKPRGKAANSDHYWFSEKGVKCFFIYTMGGIKAYHDVYDISKTLPLTKYKEVFQLLTEFVNKI